MMWGHGLTQSSHTGTKTCLHSTRHRTGLAFCRGLSCVPHQSPDRLQVAAALSATWVGRVGGSIPPATAFTAGDGGGLGGALARGTPSAQTVGTQKAARL